MPVQTTVQMRRDTAANWTSTNPTLASGEWGLETDTRLMKIGDGTTAWNSLAYQLGPMLDEVIATDPTGAYFTGSGFQVSGVTGNYASAPDAAVLDITGDIDLRVKVAMTDWTPTSAQYLLGKWTDLQKSYALQISSAGNIAFQYTTDGTTNVTRTSTVATGLTDGSTKWIRATLDANNGASGHDVEFFTSDDGTTWTKLGNTVTTAGTVTMFSGTALLQFGGVFLGTVGLLNGTIYRAQVLNGIGGTTVFDANFETVAADSFAFTESSANAATVTLTTTRYSFGIPSATLTGTSTTALVANRTNYTGFTIRKPITLKHMAFEVTAAPASTATMRLAIYKADSQAQPTGTKIIDSGAVTVATTGAAIYRVRVTPTVLQPGNYLLAINSNVIFTVRLFLSNPLGCAPNTMGANLVNTLFVAQTLSGGAFPDTGLNWNTRNTANSPFVNIAVLGWS